MFRVRLRTFLVIITLFCLLLGWRVAVVERIDGSIHRLHDSGWSIGYMNPRRIRLPDGTQVSNVGQRSYSQKLLRGFRDYDLPASLRFDASPGEMSAEQMDSFCRDSAKAMQALPTVWSVDLSGANLSTDRLAHFAKLTNLEQLYLTRTPLDDSAVDVLLKFPSLRTLHLSQTQLSDAGVNSLIEGLPECDVIHD